MAHASPPAPVGPGAPRCSRPPHRGALTVVPPDWLGHQLDLADTGVMAVAGIVRSTRLSATSSATSSAPSRPSPSITPPNPALPTPMCTAPTSAPGPMPTCGHGDGMRSGWPRSTICGADCAPRANGAWRRPRSGQPPAGGSKAAPMAVSPTSCLGSSKAADPLGPDDDYLVALAVMNHPVARFRSSIAATARRVRCRARARIREVAVYSRRRHSLPGGACPHQTT